MVFKKSFTLLVATRTTPFFAVVLIISDNDCRLGPGTYKYPIMLHNSPCIYNELVRAFRP